MGRFPYSGHAVVVENSEVKVRMEARYALLGSADSEPVLRSVFTLTMGLVYGVETRCSHKGDSSGNRKKKKEGRRGVPVSQGFVLCGFYPKFRSNRRNSGRVYDYHLGRACLGGSSEWSGNSREFLTVGPFRP